MYDAVRVVAKAMDDLASIEGFRVEPINCQQPQRFWPDGDKILSYIRRVSNSTLYLFDNDLYLLKIEYTGLTGDIEFDEDGFRTNFKLDVIEKQRGKMVRTGFWMPETGVNKTLTLTEFEGYIVEKLQNKTLRITTALVSYSNC